MTASDRKHEVDSKMPTARQLEFCAVIRNIIKQNRLDPSFLNFANYDGEVYCYCDWIIYSLFIPKKYTANMILPADIAETCRLPYEDVSLDENDKDSRRVFFSRPDDLHYIAGYLCDEYAFRLENIKETIRSSETVPGLAETVRKRFIDEAYGYIMSDNEMDRLLEAGKTADYSDISLSRHEPFGDRAAIQIFPTISLKEPSPVKMNDTRKEMQKEALRKAEDLRKNERYPEAIKVLMDSRKRGHITPSLYAALADVYHDMKEYDNEICILDEGIRCCTYGLRTLERRRARAIDSLMTCWEWRKDNTRNIVLRVTDKDDADIIDFLNTVGNKRLYLLSLIREDMAKRRSEESGVKDL